MKQVMSITTRPLHNPAHLGKILRELYMKPLGITVYAAADALKVTRKHLSAILNGRASVTPDMALRLAAAFRTDAEIWLNLQSQYDLWQVRGRKGKPAIRALVPRKAA